MAIPKKLKLISVLNNTHQPTPSMPIPYAGAPDTPCPITLATFTELEHPVALGPYAAQPYELTPLWKWVLTSGRHPLTGQVCAVQDIVVLEDPPGEGTTTKQRTDRTEWALNGLWTTLQATQEFKHEVRRIEEELDRLNHTIEQINQTVSKTNQDLVNVAGEKVRRQHSPPHAFHSLTPASAVQAGASAEAPEAKVSPPLTFPQTQRQLAALLPRVLKAPTHRLRIKALHTEPPP
jgi:hypothetical protein